MSLYVSRMGLNVLETMQSTCDLDHLLDFALFFLTMIKSLVATCTRCYLTSPSAKTGRPGLGCKSLERPGT